MATLAAKQRDTSGAVKPAIAPRRSYSMICAFWLQLYHSVEASVFTVDYYLNYEHAYFEVQVVVGVATLWHIILCLSTLFLPRFYLWLEKHMHGLQNMPSWMFIVVACEIMYPDGVVAHSYRDFFAYKTIGKPGMNLAVLCGVSYLVTLSYAALFIRPEVFRAALLWLVPAHIFHINHCLQLKSDLVSPSVAHALQVLSIGVVPMIASIAAHHGPAPPPLAQGKSKPPSPTLIRRANTPLGVYRSPSPFKALTMCLKFHDRHLDQEDEADVEALRSGLHAGGNTVGVYLGPGCVCAIVNMQRPADLSLAAATAAVASHVPTEWMGDGERVTMFAEGQHFEVLDEGAGSHNFGGPAAVAAAPAEPGPAPQIVEVGPSWCVAPGAAAEFTVQCTGTLDGDRVLVMETGAGGAMQLVSEGQISCGRARVAVPARAAIPGALVLVVVPTPPPGVVDAQQAATAVSAAVSVPAVTSWAARSELASLASAMASDADPDVAGGLSDLLSDVGMVLSHAVGAEVAPKRTALTALLGLSESHGMVNFALELLAAARDQGLPLDQEALEIEAAMGLVGLVPPPAPTAWDTPEAAPGSSPLGGDAPGPAAEGRGYYAGEGTGESSDGDEGLAARGYYRKPYGAGDVFSAVVAVAAVGGAAAVILGAGEDNGGGRMDMNGVGGVGAAGSKGGRVLRLVQSMLPMAFTETVTQSK